MILVGLTGGVGMGKSTAAKLLGARGVPVIDTDVLARQVVAPGQAALAEVRDRFGPEVIAPDGTLHRERVAQIVFVDPAKRRELEGILHPRIRERWLAQAEQWRSEGVPLGVVDIPLLYETDAAREFAAVICMACSLATQRQRLRERGWSDSQIEQRTAAQWPIQKKMDLADYVIWTEPSLEVHEGQLERVLESLRRP